MSLTNTRYNYGWVAITLHWLLFLLIAGLMASGNYSDSLPREAKDPQLIGIHKQVGVAVLMLMLFRLLWKLVNSSVRLDGSGALLRLVAHLNHWLLYAAVLAQAACGVLMSQLFGNDVFLLGFELPRFVDGREFLGIGARDMRGYHSIGGKVIAALVALHVLGALTHHFYWRDNILRRMWFGFQPGYTKDAQSHQRK